MGGLLSAREHDLRDLANGAPELIDATTGASTNARLLRCLGCGGMSTVFEAELVARLPGADLSPDTPRRFAVKVLQPHLLRELHRLGLDPNVVFAREAVALGRMMERRPPTEFVVGFFGCGQSDIALADGSRPRLPWMAIELVDGAGRGATLSSRVEHAGPAGVDPVRVLRLVTGIVEGVRALHGEDIIHRDLKPENVLIAGAIDAELPKIADCGIARVEGFAGTIGGMTPAYGGPEQSLGVAGFRNPLIGRYTDVHALSAVIWFILGGGDWCRSAGDVGWQRGERRSLMTSASLHAAFRSDPALVRSLDAVLARGAAQRLPASAYADPEAASTLSLARALYPGMFQGVERHATVDDLAADLLPLLERAASAWMLRAARENRPATAFRPTELPTSAPGSAPRSAAAISELAPPSPTDPAFAGTTGPLLPGGVVFQADGKSLLRVGADLVYCVGARSLRVAVPPDQRATVAASRWLTRGPGGGYVLAGPSHLLAIRSSRFVALPLPSRADGLEIGEIVATIEHGGTFAVVTAETDDSGGPELFTTTDGVHWNAPTLLPLNGDVRAVSYGPYGFLVVGARRNSKGRALQLGFDGHATVFSAGVNERAPLLTCLCGAGRELWAAGQGFIVSLDRAGVQLEDVDPALVNDPVVLVLDPVGVPWLLCSSRVLRRETATSRTRWVTVYERSEAAAPLVALGVSAEGARVLDAQGGGALIKPHDLSQWAGA